MNISVNSRIEKWISITETDMINGGEVMILTAYAIKSNDGIYTFPEVQIYNEEVYNRNKAVYDAQILAFRNDCENMTEDKGSVLADEILALKQDNQMIMLAISDLANLILEEKETSLEEGEDVD